jgi:PBSX family phage terminase large subunit
MPITLRGAAAVLYRCDDEEVLIEGRAGTGKTVGALKKIVDRCQAYPGSQHLVCRETRSSMTDSTLVTLESIIGDAHPEVTRCARKQRHSYSLHGSEIVIGGLDEPTKIFSTGWDTIYLNEGIEATEEAWELFGRSARDPRLRRSGHAQRRPKHQRIADCNPWAPSHWLNQRASAASDSLRRVQSYQDWCRLDTYNGGVQTGRMRRLISVHQDNPTFFDVHDWRWLEDGERYIASLKMMSGHQRTRMLEGRWVAAEGAVYPEFNEEAHVVTPFPIPKLWPCIVAKDPGRDHPDATVLAARAPLFVDLPQADGSVYRMYRLYIAAESVVRQTTVSQDAEVLTKLCSTFNVTRKVGDPHYMFSLTKMSDTGRTIAQQMRDYGHVFEPAPAAANQAQIAQQVELVRTYLTTIGPDGCPMLQVFRSCPNVIRGFQTWGYVRDTRGQMKGGEDKFEDIGDDEMDATRMIIASRPGEAEARFTVEVGE